jgi:hypothetical protein
MLSSCIETVHCPADCGCYTLLSLSWGEGVSHDYIALGVLHKRRRIAAATTVLEPGSTTSPVNSGQLCMNLHGER